MHTLKKERNICFDKHYCDLIKKNEQDSSPYEKFFVRWWKRLNKYRTVSQSVEANKYFRSNLALEKEKKRHLDHQFHKWTVHPLSKMALVESIIMSVVWLIMMTLVPFVSSFQHELYVTTRAMRPQQVAIRVCRFVATADIVFRFFLGYIITETQEIVLDRKRIVKHYLKTFCFFDLGAMLTVVAIDVFNLDRVVRLFMYQTTMLALVRSHTFFKMLDFYMKNLRLREDVRTCLNIVLTTIFALHMYTCLLHFPYVVRQELSFKRLNNSLVSKIDQDIQTIAVRQAVSHQIDWMEGQRKYYLFAGVVTCHFFGAGIGRYKPGYGFEWAMLSFILMSGMIFYVYVNARILEFFGNVNISDTKYEELVVQATDYMTFNKYQKSLRKRILKYYDCKYNKKFFSEEKIMQGMTEHLRMEVVLYSSQHLVQTLYSIKGLSRKHVATLLTLLKPEIFLPHDLIMKSDSDKHCLLMIYGTCAIELVNNMEILHAEDGDSLGNVWTHVAGFEDTSFDYQVVALETCEIYTLSIDDVKTCFEKYPNLAKKMLTLELVRVQEYDTTYAKVLERQESLGAMNILQELRYKKILHRGRSKMPPPSVNYYSPKDYY